MKLAVCLALAIITLGSFSGMRHNDFVRYDDFTYIKTNPNVQQGITPESIKWAFNIGYAANWHPLTWISHMVDVKLFGLDAAKHHMMGLGLHTASALLLFLAFSAMTGSLWRSAFVAALFAVHPLHVESVAWAAERKDVLSTFFLMLTLLSYAWYVAKPGAAKFAAAVVFFALGLLAKPMLVTLPFVLLMLDYWPLRRKESWGKLAIEKTPFMLLAIGSSVLTFIAQHSAGAVQDFQSYSPAVRVENALVVYVSYIGKMIWPARLAIPYPHPGAGIPIWQVITSALILAMLTAGFVRYSKVKPYLIVGWLWFVGTLTPVIGLVQVGGQAMADRYTYIPLIGLFVIVAWLVPDALDRLKLPSATKTAALATVSVAVLIALSVVTAKQVAVWKDTVSLFHHTISVNPKNSGALNNLGAFLQERGQLAEAEGYLRQAVEFDPTYAQARRNLGNTLFDLGRADEAIASYRAAIRLEPKSIDGYASLARALAGDGQVEEAIRAGETAVRLDTEGKNADAANNYGLALASAGRFDEAVVEFKRAAVLNPTMPEAPHNIGYALALHGKFAEAIPYYAEAIRVDPTFAAAHGHLAEALFREGDRTSAYNELQQCLRYGGAVDPAVAKALTDRKE